MQRDRLALWWASAAGQRDPLTRLRLCGAQIQRKKADAVQEALRGTWKAEHLFALKQALELWECDQEIARVLRELAGPEPEAGARKAGGQPGGPKTPQIQNLHQMLVRLCGDKDATVLPGLADHTLLPLVGEVGTDLARWKSEKHFPAWCGLPPGSKQSGKRRGNTARQRNRAGRLFCVMARSVGRSVDKALGGYRRLKGRRGGLVANQALARKLAALFWRLMVKRLIAVPPFMAKCGVSKIAGALSSNSRTISMWVLSITISAREMFRP